MYYKLYIDSVFFMQFVMNLYLLSITGKILKCTATHRRIFFGALLGAGAMCLIMVLPVGRMKPRLFCGIVPVSMCMMRIVFGIPFSKTLLKSSLLMGMSGFFFGSIILWLENVTAREGLQGENPGCGIWSAVFYGYIGYCFFQFVIRKGRQEGKQDSKEVCIPIGDKKVILQALVDTGNHLREPVTGSPVCIVSKQAAALLEKAFVPEHFHVIPYRSIGKKSGLLKAYEVPELIIKGGYQELHRKQVIVAICNAGISQDSTYQMILHPQLLED